MLYSIKLISLFPVVFMLSVPELDTTDSAKFLQLIRIVPPELTNICLQIRRCQTAQKN